MEPELHPDVASLAALLGSWTGTGHGEYPTIEPFDYEEQITFTHTGKPFLVYSQRTQHSADGRPLHGESGYWRVARPGRVELVVAHPNGIVEVAEGSFDTKTVLLSSTVIGRTSTAKLVTAIERDFVFEDDVLRYALRMSAMGEPLTHHLAAELRRVDPLF